MHSSSTCVSCLLLYLSSDKIFSLRTDPRWIRNRCARMGPPTRITTSSRATAHCSRQEKGPPFGAVCCPCFSISAENKRIAQASQWIEHDPYLYIQKKHKLFSWAAEVDLLTLVCQYMQIALVGNLRCICRMFYIDV